MTTVDASAAAATATRLPRLGLAMIHTLVLQLLLGLANTFWLTVPDSGSGWGHSSPAWLLYAHILLGVALLVLAVWIALAARTAGDRGWSRASVAGIAGIIVAFAGGSSFMGQVESNLASFVMALGWALALSGYATGLARSARGATVL